MRRKAGNFSLVYSRQLYVNFMQGNVLDAASYSFVQLLFTVRSGSEKLCLTLLLSQNTVSRHAVCFLTACILKPVSEKEY